MPALADTYLAFILFLPWFAILGGLYMLFPRKPGGAARRLFDLAALALTVVLSLVSMQWAYHNATLSHGPLWRQLLATSVGYGVFLLVLGIAVGLRWAWLRGRRTA